PGPIAERLVERLAEHLAEPEPVPALDVDRDLAVRRGRVERSDEQPQRPVSKPGRRPAIGNAPGRGCCDLGERRTARSSYVDADCVADDEVRLRDDRRDSMRPAQELRAGADGEVLVVAQADELLERDPV